MADMLADSPILAHLDTAALPRLKVLLASALELGTFEGNAEMMSWTDLLAQAFRGFHHFGLACVEC